MKASVTWEERRRAAGPPNCVAENGRAEARPIDLDPKVCPNAALRAWKSLLEFPNLMAFAD